MLKLITIVIGCSLGLAAGALAEKPNKDAGKKPKAQKQQVAPQQHQMKAPKTQVQKVHPEHVNRSMVNTTHTNGPKKDTARRMTPIPTHTPATVQSAKIQKNRTQLETVRKPKPLEMDANRQTESVRTNNNEQFQANNQRIQNNKLNQQQIQQIRAQHRNFKAQRNSSVASVQFNQNYQIRNAQNWSGSNYQVFRSYRPQWHDQGWWRSHHTRLSLIAGGWYFWNAGYWYPAWGYDDAYSYYPYDGPIYSGPSARPFDQVVADVQAALQEQGYYRGEVDGLLGPLTREALAGYQSSHGLYVTETIDRPTLDSIGLG
jgi:putative peptidoglycan binding protein